TAPAAAKPRYMPLVLRAMTAPSEPLARGRSHACIGGLNDHRPAAHTAVTPARTGTGTAPAAVRARTARTAVIATAVPNPIARVVAGPRRSAPRPPRRTPPKPAAPKTRMRG